MHSQGGVEIGRAVVIGGGAKISGGAFQIERSAADETSTGSSAGMAAREQTRWTSSPVRIGDKS